MSENSKPVTELGNIEFIEGNEWHSSWWYKFYVKGLESYQVEEDFPQAVHDRHCKYKGFVCLDVPSETVFSVFRQDGNKRGTDEFDFWLCQVATGSIEKIQAAKVAFVGGNFKIICHASGKVKAPRLLGWWADNKGLHSLDFARHCAENIVKRGIKELPPFDGRTPVRYR